MNAKPNNSKNFNPDPITDEPGTHPAATGLGAVGGGATGAAIGAVGGPAGVAVGAVIGAVAGGLAGKGVAETANPATTEAGHAKKSHRTKYYAEEPAIPADSERDGK